MRLIYLPGSKECRRVYVFNSGASACKRKAREIYTQGGYADFLIVDGNNNSYQRCTEVNERGLRWRFVDK